MVLLIFVAANVAEKLLSCLRKKNGCCYRSSGTLYIPYTQLCIYILYIYEIAILKHETVCKVSTIAKCKKMTLDPVLPECGSTVWISMFPPNPSIHNLGRWVLTIAIHSFFHVANQCSAIGKNPLYTHHISPSYPSFRHEIAPLLSRSMAIAAA